MSLWKRFRLKKKFSNPIPLIEAFSVQPGVIKWDKRSCRASKTGPLRRAATLVLLENKIQLGKTNSWERESFSFKGNRHGQRKSDRGFEPAQVFRSRTSRPVAPD